MTHSHECDTTHSWVWYDSFVSVIWLVTRRCTAAIEPLLCKCGMTRSWVWRDSFESATWLIHECDMRQSVTWLIHECDVTHSGVQHDSFMSVTWGEVWRDLFVSVTWLIHECDMRQRDCNCCHTLASCVWRSLLVGGWWLTRECEMTHLSVWHDSWVGHTPDKRGSRD